MCNPMQAGTRLQQFAVVFRPTSSINHLLVKSLRQLWSSQQWTMRAYSIEIVI